MNHPSKIILQLELKDVFFHFSKDNPNNLETIGVEGDYYIIRNNTSLFFETLAPHFTFSIWTNYNLIELSRIEHFLRSLNFPFLYFKSAEDGGQTFHESSFKTAKRLKGLKYLHEGAEVERIIVIENAFTALENYQNQFIITPFTGMVDDALIDACENLLKLASIKDTRTINL